MRMSVGPGTGRMCYTVRMHGKVVMAAALFCASSAWALPHVSAPLPPVVGTVVSTVRADDVRSEGESAGVPRSNSSPVHFPSSRTVGDNGPYRYVRNGMGRSGCLRWLVSPC